MAVNGLGGHATFVLPALPRGTHSLVVCDDPCTTWGFGEWVQGWVTAAPTTSEARLLVRIRELRATLWDRSHELNDDLRHAQQRERRLEDELGTLTRELQTARTRIDRLSSTSAGSRADPAPLVDGAAGAWIASALIATVGMWLLGRRRRTIVVPDTPAELLAPGSPAWRAAPSERILEDLDV